MLQFLASDAFSDDREKAMVHAQAFHCYQSKNTLMETLWDGGDPGVVEDSEVDFVSDQQIIAEDGG